MRFASNLDEDLSMRQTMLPVNEEQSDGNEDHNIVEDNCLPLSEYKDNSIKCKLSLSEHTETSKSIDKRFKPILNGYQAIPSDILKLELAQYLLNLNPQLLEEILSQTSTSSIRNFPNNASLSMDDYSVQNTTHFFVPVEDNILKSYHQVHLVPQYQMPITMRSNYENTQLLNDEFYITPVESKIYSNQLMNLNSQEVAGINKSPDCIPDMDSCDNPQQTYIIFSINNELNDNTEQFNQLCFDSSTSPEMSNSLPLENNFIKLTDREHSKGMLSHYCTTAINEQNNFELTTFETTSPSLGAGSRFRVKRIADANSWWTPKSTKCPLVVHDLKTSSLPEFIHTIRSRNDEIQRNILSGVIKSIGDMQVRFWNVLDPKYLQKNRHKAAFKVSESASVSAEKLAPNLTTTFDTVNENENSEHQNQEE